MDIRNAINVLKESQGGHSYDIYVPSLEKEIAFKSLKIGQLKTLNKFAISDEDKFYKALSSLILELSDSAIDLSEINEIDRVLILSEIKKNNTTSPESIKMTCSECESEFSHDLEIDNYDDDESLRDKISDFTLEQTIGEIEIKCTIGLPTVQEQIELKELITQGKRKAESTAKRKTKTMLNMSKEDVNRFVNDAVSKEERFLNSNTDFLFLKGLKFGEQDVEIKGDTLVNRSNLFDQLPANIKGEVSTKISSHYENTLGHFLKYNVTCPNCKETFTEEVSISSFFTI
jgi:hypothetical protein